MFEVNDRVWVVGYGFNGKIVGITFDKTGTRLYQVREFAHPHQIVWVDDCDLELPRGNNHADKR